MAARSFRFIVDRGGQRIDRLVADATGEGRRTVKALLAAGLVRSDGRSAVRGSDPAAQGSEIVVDFPGRPQPSADAELHVVLEAPHLLVVAKPAGLRSESGRSQRSLAALLLARFEELEAVGDRPSEAG